MMGSGCLLKYDLNFKYLFQNQSMSRFTKMEPYNNKKKGMTKRTKPNIGTINLNECGFTGDHCH